MTTKKQIKFIKRLEKITDLCREVISLTCDADAEFRQSVAKPKTKDAGRTYFSQEHLDHAGAVLAALVRAYPGVSVAVKQPVPGLPSVIIQMRPPEGVSDEDIKRVMVAARNKSERDQIAVRTDADRLWTAIETFHSFVMRGAPVTDQIRERWKAFADSLAGDLQSGLQGVTLKAKEKSDGD